jgi:hypothetical protein
VPHDLHNVSQVAVSGPVGDPLICSAPQNEATVSSQENLLLYYFSVYRFCTFLPIKPFMLIIKIFLMSFCAV